MGLGKVLVSQERHDKAMCKVASLVNVRERHAGELKARLAKAGFSAEEVADAVETALRCNLVSDERFVRSYIRGKSASGWGKRKIIMRLRQEGLPDDLIEECSDEFPGPEAEYEQALHELARRPSHSKDPYASYMRRLVGKGYSYETARSAVKDFMSL